MINLTHELVVSDVSQSRRHSTHHATMIYSEQKVSESEIDTNSPLITT